MPHPRHWLARVRQRTRVKNVNTVIESGVDVRGDIDAINRGEGIRRGNIYAVRGRVYGLHSDGHTYPVDGVGFHRLDRLAFRALGVYNTFGPSARAEEILDQMQLSADHREAGFRVWRAERH